MTQLAIRTTQFQFRFQLSAGFPPHPTSAPALPGRNRSSDLRSNEQKNAKKIKINKWSSNSHLSQKYLYQQLLKSDNSSSTYSEEC